MGYDGEGKCTRDGGSTPHSVYRASHIPYYSLTHTTHTAPTDTKETENQKMEMGAQAQATGGSRGTAVEGAEAVISMSSPSHASFPLPTNC